MLTKPPTSIYFHLVENTLFFGRNKLATLALRASRQSHWAKLVSWEEVPCSIMRRLKAPTGLTVVSWKNDQSNLSPLRIEGSSFEWTPNSWPKSHLLRSGWVQLHWQSQSASHPNMFWAEPIEIGFLLHMIGRCLKINGQRLTLRGPAVAHSRPTANRQCPGGLWWKSLVGSTFHWSISEETNKLNHFLAYLKKHGQRSVRLLGLAARYFTPQRTRVSPRTGWSGVLCRLRTS